MKKTLLLLTILIIAAFSTYAQHDTSPKFSAGFAVGGTVGVASSAYPAAGELVLKFEYPVNESPLSLTFTTGYTFYVSKDGYYTGYYDNGYDSGSYSSGSLVSFAPVMVGAKVFVAGKFFVVAEGGLSFNLNSNSEYYTGKKIAPIVAPGVGYRIPFGSSDRFSMDLGLGYENRIETGGGYSQVAFHAAFNLGL